MRSNKERIIYKGWGIQFPLNIRPDYNYLHKIKYIYIYIYNIYIYIIYTCKNKKNQKKWGECKDCHEASEQQWKV